MEYLDPIGPSTSQAVYKDLIKKHQEHKLPRTCVIKIQALDPVGIVVEEWKIEGTYKLVDFSDSSYASDALQKITIIFEPINCSL